MKMKKMSEKRIQQLADFFYSSNSSEDVPLRLAISTGQYAGFDLNKQEFIDLLIILSKSEDLKSDLALFLEKVALGAKKLQSR